MTIDHVTRSVQNTEEDAAIDRKQKKKTECRVGSPRCEGLSKLLLLVPSFLDVPKRLRWV